jgi:hypothetical protein
MSRRLKCPRCSAMKEQTAVIKCRPQRGYDDEYDCPMNYVKTDADGWFLADNATKGRGDD